MRRYQFQFPRIPPIIDRGPCVPETHAAKVRVNAVRGKIQSGARHGHPNVRVGAY